MHYRITHRTTYRYGETVPLCQNALWLTPRDGGGQRREAFRLSIEPAPSARSTRTDYFGNEVVAFTIDSGFRSLDITAVSEVRTAGRSETARLPETPPWERVAADLCRDLTDAGIDACQFRFDSPMAAADDALAGYARESFTPDRPIAEAARDLSARIHRDFFYEPGATDVSTSVAEAFAIRRGVCQDFAHVAIAGLRSLGLSARYVSGYLRTVPPPGQPRLVGADASHAWFSVYCGPTGWLDLDPTNDRVVSDDHVVVAVGRDYQDVTPVKGLFVGGGRHEMEVRVDVAPIDEPGEPDH